MSDKTKKILKIFLTIGIVLSAAAAIFAVIMKMQKKLCAVKDEEADDEICNGSCSECTMCDTEALDESDEEAEEATEE